MEVTESLATQREVKAEPIELRSLPSGCRQQRS
jgi:hypothetical protein